MTRHNLAVKRAGLAFRENQVSIITFPFLLQRFDQLPVFFIKPGRKITRLLPFRPWVAVYLVEQAPTEAVWAGGLLLGVLVISLAVAAEFGSLSVDDPGYARSRLALNVLAYLLAFVFFYMIYRTRSRSIITASGVTLVSFMLALDLLSVADVGVGRVALYAVAVALLVGESTWALNYWRLSDWAGSLSLLVVFYLAGGIAHQNLLERLSGRVLIEFGLVAAMALLFITFLGR